MTRIRVAVIGGGHLGKIHARLLNASERFELVAVAEANDTTRAALQADMGFNTVADYHDLLDRIDAAVVAVPTVAHHRVVTDLLESRIHCLVEKPITTTAEQAAELCRLAKALNCVFQVGHVERFNPAWRAIEDQIQTPNLIEATRTSGYSGRSTDIGVVLDLMIHDLDLILSAVQSPVVDVQASGLRLLGDYEDSAEARLTFEDGCVALIRSSRVSATPTRKMNIFSRERMVEIDFSTSTLVSTDPCEAIKQATIQAESLSHADRMIIKDTLLTEWLPRSSITVEPRNAIADELEDFAQSITTGETPLVSGLDGMRALEVAERILDAIAENDRVRHRHIEKSAPRILPFRRAA